MTSDVIDRLAGIAAGSSLDTIRAARPDARSNAERSFAALFRPETPGEVTETERYAVATFVAGLHRDGPSSAFYAADFNRLDPALATLTAAELEAAATRGPYGHYASDVLAPENSDGPRWRVSPDGRDGLGTRLAAAFAHAHMLVFRPREADPAALQSLLDAGWSTTAIVTLSQLVSFLTFQIRVAAGLRTLAGAAA